MTQDFTLHCHTTFSDGKNTLEEMVAAAKKKGFGKIGISDHLIFHKNIRQSPSWEAMSKYPNAYIYRADFKQDLEQFQRHGDEIRKLSKKLNFPVYIGYEVDFFTYNGWLEEFKDFISQLDYDYLVSGNHFFFQPDCKNIINIDRRGNYFLNDEQAKEYIHFHFDAIKKSIESGVFKFVAHLDYVRRVGENIYNVLDYKKEIDDIIKALKLYHTGTEISTKGLRRGNDFYPEKNILEKIAANNIPIVISDDAHSVSELGENFEKAEKELKKYKIFNRLS